MCVCVRVWWQAVAAPCPFPPASLKRMSWWVRIGGRCCLVLGSPDGLSSRQHRARYILEKTNFQSSANDLQARLSNVQERKERESVFIRSGKAAGQCLIEVQLFPQTSLTPVKWWKKTLLNNLPCISGGLGAMWGENSGCGVGVNIALLGASLQKLQLNFLH